MTPTGKLEFWEDVYDAENSLLDIVKGINIPRNFTIYLKYSQLILKLFLQDGMPAVEKSLKGNADRVKALLKSVQGTTRFLHRLCCQSKSVKNAAIIPLIPGLRQVVESFNYAVKAALVANKCLSAFLLGNLKNNDLEGEEILSQVVSLTNDTDGEDGEQSVFPADDETLDGTGFLGVTAICHPSQGTSTKQKPSVSGKRGRSSRAKK